MTWISDVLILVVVDNGLVPEILYNKFKHKKVLILVVVDNGLVLKILLIRVKRFKQS